MPNGETPKPGWKTTEFWLALAGQVFGLLMVVGLISPDQSAVLTDAASQATALGVDTYMKGFGIISMVGSAFGYAISRGKAKGGG